MEKNASIMIFLGLCFLPAGFPRTYFLVENSLTWSGAQNYCREKYTDLASVKNEEEMEKVAVAGQPYYSGHLWIGLYNVNSWTWSLEEECYYGAGETEFRMWGSGEPNNFGGNENCVTMVNDGFWNDGTCSYEQQFVCYSAANSSFIVVNQYKTWSDAQLYCREFYTDLASVRNQADNDQINKMRQGQVIWIGLHKEQWGWSDGTPLSFSQWSPGKPSGNMNTPCVLLHNNRWEDALCESTLYFVCYIGETSGLDVQERKKVVRVEVTKSDPDKNLEDAARAMLQQMCHMLGDQGLSRYVRLTWRKQPDGKIFKLEDKSEEKKTEHCSLS